MKLSVVVPTRNRVEKLRHCLASLASQGEAANVAEVVVVDDGSRDGTRAFLESATRQRWPFALESLSQPARGPAAARNAGVAKARGELVLFTADDCVAAPGLLEEHLAAHAAIPGTGSVLGHTSWLPSLRITPFMHFQENGGSQFAYGRIRDARDAGWNYYYTANVSTPRHVLLEHRFDERFPAARYEGMELGWRLARTGHRIAYVPEALCWHDHPISFQEFRRKSLLYGGYAVLFHRIHPEEELACALGIRDACEVLGEHVEALDWAERSVLELEAAFPCWEPHPERFAVRGGLEMLHSAYRLLVHHALVSGIRRALGLAPLGARARAVSARPRAGTLRDDHVGSANRSRRTATPPRGAPTRADAQA